MSISPTQLPAAWPPTAEVAREAGHEPQSPLKVIRAKLHAHIKPIGLISRLIGAVTKPGDLVVDPAAGSFVVMKAAHALGREFIGCDLIWEGLFGRNPCAEEKARESKGARS
jgi:hypothetical protein